jgi:hypothetical protein
MFAHAFFPSTFFAGTYYPPASGSGPVAPVRIYRASIEPRKRLKTKEERKLFAVVEKALDGLRDESVAGTAAVQDRIEKQFQRIEERAAGRVELLVRLESIRTEFATVVREREIDADDEDVLFLQ